MAGEEPSRRELMAELGEALLGGLARGVDGDDATAAATGASVPDKAGPTSLGAKQGVLVEGGPVESS